MYGTSAWPFNARVASKSGSPEYTAINERWTMELSILPKKNENGLKIVELIEQRETDRTNYAVAR